MSLLKKYHVYRPVVPAFVVALTLLMAPGMQATALGETILSSGPLTHIETTPELGCAVNYGDDSHGEFYGDTACGTLVAVDGTLYGPASIPAGGSASPLTPWTPLTQEVGGAGTATDPYRVVTSVTGGGLEIVQTDTYVVGAESYGTRVRVRNQNGSPKNFTVYRVGDCYLQDSDFGYGVVDAGSGSVACAAGTEPGSRIEQWAPLTPGSHYLEAFYDDVWAAVGSQAPLPDTCTCDTYLDNGAGLSWSTSAGAGAEKSFSHLTAFSPTGVEAADSDGDGFPDTWEEPGGTGADLDLAEMGATPDKPDIFVQVGWLDGRSCFLFFCSSHTHRPSLAALREVQKAFARRGIRLHVDAGPSSLMNPDNGARWGSRSRAGGTEGPERIPGASGNSFDWAAAFNGYRGRLLPANRSRVFHFALYVGSWDAAGHSGIARGAGGGTAGPDLIFAHDVFEGGSPGRMEEAGTVMHELGHNLGLSHGGSVAEAGVNYKVNYPSVMNYAWQFSGVYKYSTLGLLDYSDGTLDPVDENSLSESAGLDPNSAATDIATKWSCPDRRYTKPKPSAFDVDWNCNGHIDSGTLKANLNDPSRAVHDSTLSTFKDFDDWSNLVFDGGGALGGAGDPGTGEVETVVDEAPAAELEAAAGEPWTVDLTGPEQITMQSHTAAPVDIRIVNRDGRSHSYDLTVFGEGVGVEGLPATVSLGPGEARVLSPILQAGSATDTAFFEVDASSDEPANGDSAIAEVFVVDHVVADQPGVSGSSAASGGSAADRAAASPGGVPAQITVLTRRTVLRKGGRIPVRLGCGGGVGRCVGALSLKQRSGKRGSRRARQAKRRRANSRASFSVPSGARSTVRVRLNRSMLRKLRRAPRQRLVLLATARTSVNTTRRRIVALKKHRVARRHRRGHVRR